MKQQNARFMSRKEAADILRVSMQTVSNMCHDGILAFSYDRSGRMHIDGESVMAVSKPLIDINEARKKLDVVKAEIEAEVDAYEKDLYKVVTGRTLLSEIKSLHFQRFTMNEIMRNAGLGDRIQTILAMIADGKTMQQIVQRIGMKRERVMIAAHAAVRTIVKKAMEIEGRGAEVKGRGSRG